jgi:hypothetical protein
MLLSLRDQDAADRERPLPGIPAGGLAAGELVDAGELIAAGEPLQVPPPLSYGRPRAPTPSASPPSDFVSLQSIPLIPLYSSDSPVSISSDSPSFSHPPLNADSELPHDASHLSPKSFMPLPDPSQFPDPYPFRPPHSHLPNIPALSSAGSSSTRSSAYTSSGSGRSAMASGDYGHVHIASGDDEAVGVGITSDDVVQLLVNDPNSSGGIQSRAPIDQSRWSESYSIRSRSSSLGNNLSNNGHDSVSPKLRQKPSYDVGWQTVHERDERDEVAISEEETDDDHPLDEEDDDDEEKEEERTSAAVIAEEGRGLIVHGDNIPIVQLHVQPGEFLDTHKFYVLNSFRHYPSFDRIFKHSERNARVLDVHSAPDWHHAPCFRYIGQLSGCFASRACSL